MSLKSIFNKWKKRTGCQEPHNINRSNPKPHLTGSLTTDEQAIYRGLGEGADIIRRKLLIGNTPAVLIYIDGIVDEKLIHHDVLNKLQQVKVFPPQDIGLSYIAQKILSTSTTKNSLLFADIYVDILLGNTVLLVEGIGEALIISTRGGERRAVSEPPTERTTRGSREGFVEDITVNLAFIRRKIKSTDLAIEIMHIGERSKTKVAIAYITDIADPKIIQEVRRRLSKIKIDAVLGSGYIERLIEDNHWSLFPQTFGTERPDRVAANMLEGRIAIVVDGTPYVLVVPTLFIQFFQGSEDYFERLIVGSVARLVRFLAFIITTTLTAVYIALVTFHHSLLPTDLLHAVIEARQKVPFTPLIEALYMEIIIEILREAGLRLPQPVGQTLGVVGGIVLGQAVIQANLVSPLIIVVVALSAISSFVFPNYSASLAIRLIKFPMMILAAMFGALGIAVGWVFFTIHLASMQSFGVPYLAPLAPTRYADLRDTFIWSSFKYNQQRPVSMPHLDDKRSGKDGKE